MADFVDPSWHWFIVIATIVSLLACLWLVLANRRSDSDSVEGEPTGHVWDEDLRELNNPLPRWWFNLFLITLIFGGVYLVLYPGLGSFPGVLHWTQLEQYQDEVAEANATYNPLFEKFMSTDIPALVKNKEAQVAGERLFANYCTQCHGSDARGAPGFPNLRDDAWLYGGSPEAITQTLTNGRRGVMPAWAGALGEEGVENVTSYVESLAGRDVDADMAAKGKEKFNMLCIACHLPDGTGNQALGAPNLTDDDWLYGGTRRTISESIANGRNGVMPAHGEFLGEAKIHVLAAYVYGLSKNN
ncbi:MAG: Cbb3-type cytochrome c oxidase subunit [marine bacterium B5-7]|nr:MAG: Cbb3-type cytochrome c oxidase subunit [marine bacterium B5-7]